MQEMRIYLLNNTKPYREGEEEYSGAWFNALWTLRKSEKKSVWSMKNN